MAHKRRRRSYWTASLIVIGICGCTPREIEKDVTQELPRPGGSDQHRLDSIKRELNIKRQQQEQR